MRIWASMLFCLVMTACAQAPVVQSEANEGLFHDALFGASSDRVSAADVFALSNDMRHYLDTEIARQARVMGAQRALVEALYQRRQLKLEYDAALTRNAAQAFEARSGNCLSLVIMTAAFAKQLGVRVEYHSALHEETWSRNGNLYVLSGHVNVTLGQRTMDSRGSLDARSVTIDFLPGDQITGLRTRAIDEKTVLAMFMNNRAAEALVQGRINDAYAWAREAVQQQPRFISAYNTLGLVYLRRGALGPAEQVFRHVLARDAENTRALANLAQVLTQGGRDTESAEMRARLARIEPYPPFHFFNLGVAAMTRNDYQAARDWFAKEVDRADYYHEFHFWLALANFKLGDLDQARKHLARAAENSTTRRDHDLYAAKLAWMQSFRQHQ